MLSIRPLLLVFALAAGPQLPTSSATFPVSLGLVLCGCEAWLQPAGLPSLQELLEVTVLAEDVRQSLLDDIIRAGMDESRVLINLGCAGLVSRIEALI